MQLNQSLLKFDESGTKVYIPTERYSIDLSLTENPLGFSNKVLEVIDKEKYHVNHYPDPYHKDLRAFLSKKYNLPEDNFTFGTGADGLIENIIRILVNPGDEVVMPDLTFLNASFATTIAGGNTVFSPMKSDLHIDFTDLKRRITERTKIVFLCNPNNPTGYIENKDDIVDLIKSTESLVVIDEANIEFTGETVINLVNQYSNLMVVRTFSKGYGLAGMRIGFCAGSADLMRYIWRLRPPFTNTFLAQKAALAALADEDHINKSRNYVQKETEFLTDELSKRGFTVLSSQANCFLVKVTPLFNTSTEFNELLHKNDATVVDGKHFRGLGTDYVRIAPQKHETNIEFIKIIDKLIQNKQKNI